MLHVAWHLTQFAMKPSLLMLPVVVATAAAAAKCSITKLLAYYERHQRIVIISVAVVVGTGAVVAVGCGRQRRLDCVIRIESK